MVAEHVWGIRARQVFDGTMVAERPTVLVTGSSIVSVGEPLPPDIEVVDLPESLVMPGLVDCHQHLVFDGQGTLEEQVTDRSDAELAARSRSLARQALEGGVTTVRDLGDRGFVTLELRDDPTLPHVLCAGPPITLPGGHCHYLGGECGDDSALASAVDERSDRGCDVVKIMVTGGALTPGHPVWKSQFELEQVRAVVDRAHAAGLPVAAHCHGVRGIRDALAAGVDTIEHCSFFDESMDVDVSDDLVDLFASSGTAVSATLGALPGRKLPPVWQAATKNMRAAFGRVHEAGGTVLVGTDAGISPFKPHDVMPRAMADLVDVGMTTTEALAAMTSRAASTLRVDDRGRLAPGMVADVIAVDGDPLSDPADLANVSRVWRAGQAI